MSKNQPASDRESRNEIRELRTELKEIKESMNFFNKVFEDMKNELATAQKERDALKGDNAELRKKCVESENKIRELGQRLVQCEQYSRRSNIEIRGLVETNGENVADLVSRIGDAVGEPISNDEMEACHRVPTREAGKSTVVVQFRSRQKRDALLEMARKKRVKNSQVGIQSEEQIYLNDHLCPTLKRLLSLALARKREFKWRFVWTRHGKIFARKTESANLVRIESENDLQKIV